MLDGYYLAFARFLRSGDPGALANYCDAHAELAFLDVYRNGFLKACTDVLRSNYPSVDHLVGETYFSALAQHYVETHPPRDANLVAYGEHFASLIEDMQEVHGLAYLAAVAQLDRAWTEVYFAADAPLTETPDAGALAGMTDDAIMQWHCRLVPGARLLSLDYSALDAWTHLRSGALLVQTEILKAPIHILMWCTGKEIAFRALSDAEHKFVTELADGRACADAAIAAVAVDAHFDVSTGFGSLLRDGLLILDPEHLQGGS